MAERVYYMIPAVRVFIQIMTFPARRRLPDLRIIREKFQRMARRSAPGLKKSRFHAIR